MAGRGAKRGRQPPSRGGRAEGWTVKPRRSTLGVHAAREWLAVRVAARLGKLTSVHVPPTLRPSYMFSRYYIYVFSLTAPTSLEKNIGTSDPPTLRPSKSEN